MRWAWMGGLLFSLAACGSSESPDEIPRDAGFAEDRDGGAGEDGLVPDFALVDMNATSPTSGMAVSPRDLLGKVSGWYFTHAS